MAPHGIGPFSSDMSISLLLVLACTKSKHKPFENGSKHIIITDESCQCVGQHHAVYFFWQQKSLIKYVMANQLELVPENGFKMI